jgi:hypothetical protein
MSLPAKEKMMCKNKIDSIDVVSNQSGNPYIFVWRLRPRLGAKKYIMNKNNNGFNGSPLRPWRETCGGIIREAVG